MRSSRCSSRRRRPDSTSPRSGGSSPTRPRAGRETSRIGSGSSNSSRTHSSPRSSNTSQDLQSVLVDIEHTKVATQQVHAAELTAAEGVALLDTGNYSAAIDRVARARETIGTSLANVGLPPAEGESGNSAPLSIVPLVGPSIVACLYVAIGAILLPGSDAFLTTYYIANTTAILFVSYGWFGLILYSLLSVYILARSSFLRGIDYEVPLDGI